MTCGFLVCVSWVDVNSKTENTGGEENKTFRVGVCSDWRILKEMARRKSK